MIRATALTFAALLSACPASAGETASANEQDRTVPKLLFHLSFDDGSLVARGSGGPVEPLSAPKAPVFEEGKRGKALRMSPERAYEIAYPTKGNLDLNSGTISWWVKYPVDFCERARGDVFRTGDKDSCNAITVRFHWTTRRKAGFWFIAYFHAKRLRPVRFTVMDWQSRVVSKWKPGEWHHVMIVWDTLRGVTKYFDGKAASGPPTNNGPFVFLDPSSEMIFGPANLSLDEFRVYDRPLTPAALARLTGLPPGEDLPENVEVQYLYVR